jgi:hypothetical protein
MNGQIGSDRVYVRHGRTQESDSTMAAIGLALGGVFGLVGKPAGHGVGHRWMWPCDSLRFADLKSTGWERVRLRRLSFVQHRRGRHNVRNGGWRACRFVRPLAAPWATALLLICIPKQFPHWVLGAAWHRRISLVLDHRCKDFLGRARAAPPRRRCHSSPTPSWSSLSLVGCERSRKKHRPERASSRHTSQQQLVRIDGE